MMLPAELERVEEEVCVVGDEDEWFKAYEGRLFEDEWLKRRLASRRMLEESETWRV